MIHIKLIPKEGIQIGKDVKVVLGCDVDMVRKLIGDPSRIFRCEFNDEVIFKHFYEEFEMRLDFSEEYRLQFIEFIYGPYPEKCALEIFDINPFAVEADYLIQMLTDKNNRQVDSVEAPYGYGFNRLGIGIWRGAVPSDFESWINEAKEEKTYEQDKESIEFENERSKYFWTIGLGMADYYS